MNESTRMMKFGTPLVHGNTAPGSTGTTKPPIVQARAIAHETAEALLDVFPVGAIGSALPHAVTPPVRSVDEILSLSSVFGGTFSLVRDTPSWPS